MTSESIALSEAQNLILKKQKLFPSSMGKSKDDIANLISDLCGIQYDPLPIIAQAHCITLWNRVKGFKADWLDSLIYKKRKLIEFMLMRQTLNIVVAEELPYYFQGTRSVARKGWIQGEIDKKENETSNAILQKLSERGEVSPKDFHFGAFRPLFYSGKIFITRRNSGIFRMPYYRLFSECFPNIDLQSISEIVARKYLVFKTLSAFGVSPSRHVAYWTGYKVKETENILQELEKDSVVTKIVIEGLRGHHWITNEDFNNLGKDVGKEDFVALLTLMDNLVRDRRWLQQFFNYTFEVEYFQKKGMKWHVNILCSNEFLGFINPKIDRLRRIFIIKDIALKRKLESEEWRKVLERIEDFANFHGAEAVRVMKPENHEIHKALRRHGFCEEEKGKLSLKLN